jgi:3-phenylpropionate/trans-cinnamate dioxygenase ferredoxin reductase subunit
MAPRVVIVGASLAGLRTAEAVLSVLPHARVCVIGDEPHPPYNRPPLSKDVVELLADPDPAVRGGAFAKVVLRHRLADDRVDWVLGSAAVSHDGAARVVELQDGRRFDYDWLVVATGLRPRRLPFAGLDGRRFVLRSFDDALRLGRVLRRGARMLVVGAGFVGCEIASTAARIGLTVSVVEPAPAPMRLALGTAVADAMAGFHRRNGVSLSCGVSVTGLSETGVRLSDGTTAEADVIVEAVGSLPNTDVLAGAGLDLSNGVLCDATLTAVGSDRILAVGDVARFPNALLDDVPRRIEHWCVPAQTARRAGETIHARHTGTPLSRRFAPLPSFWSDQHGMRLQSIGAPFLGDEIAVLDGRLDRIGDEPCLVEYRRSGRPIGILGLGVPPASLTAHRLRLERALTETLAA